LDNSVDLDAKRRERDKLKLELVDTAVEIELLQQRQRGLSSQIAGINEYIASYEPKPRNVTLDNLEIPTVTIEETIPALRPTVIDLMSRSTRALTAGEIWEIAAERGCRTKQKYPSSAVHFVMQGLVKNGLARKAGPGKWKWIGAPKPQLR